MKLYDRLMVLKSKCHLPGTDLHLRLFKVVISASKTLSFVIYYVCDKA